MNILGTLKSGFKALSIFRDTDSPAMPRSLYTPSYFVDPDQSDIWDNSAVAACLSTAMDAYIEAPLYLWERKGEDEDGEAVWEKLPDHPISQLLETPNPYYTGVELRQATLLSRLCDGNGYNLIVEDGNRQPLELWYEPHYAIEPYWSAFDSTAYIESYRRLTGHTIETENVIHMRSGLDPRNTRKGLASLKAAMRTVKADDEIDVYAYAVTRRKGVVGLMVMPKDPADEFDPATAEEIEQRIASKVSGDQRGGTLVMSRPVELAQPNASPKDMDLTGNSRRSEERISGILNTPAILAGLGAGLDRSTFANMEEAQRYFSQRFLVPKWEAEGRSYSRSLLPRFGLDMRRYKVAVDAKRVQALQDDREQLHKVADGSFNAGWIDRYTAKRIAKLQPEEEDRGVYKSAPTPVDQAVDEAKKGIYARRIAALTHED